jgi:hypothetical protein
MSNNVFCEWCGADESKLPCEIVRCCSGYLAIPDNNGQLEYMHRDDLRRQTEVALRNSWENMPEVLTRICVDYVLPIGRINPALMPHVEYLEFMEEAMVAVKNRLVCESCRPEDRDKVNDGLSEWMYNDAVAYEESWFEHMCERHKAYMDVNFQCEADAMSAAEVVFGMGDSEGQTISFFIFEELRQLGHEMIWDYAV